MSSLIFLTSFLIIVGILLLVDGLFGLLSRIGLSPEVYTPIGFIMIIGGVLIQVGLG